MPYESHTIFPIDWSVAASKDRSDRITVGILGAWHLVIIIKVVPATRFTR